MCVHCLHQGTCVLGDTESCPCGFWCSKAKVIFGIVLELASLPACVAGGGMAHHIAHCPHHQLFFQPICLFTVLYLTF